VIRQGTPAQHPVSPVDPVELKISDAARRRIERILSVRKLDFRAMAEAAGLNPMTSFRGADLSGVDFGKSDLRNVDFSSAKLQGCDFSGANISKTIFFSR
jgi:hypothetical protein